MSGDDDDAQADALTQLLGTIQAGPQGGGRPSDAPKPLGVPDKYYVERDVERPQPLGYRGNRFVPGSYSTRTAVPPRYFDGHQYVPGGLPVEDVATLQRKLVAAGLLRGSYRIGVWDAESIAAYQRLLEFANVSGLDEQEALLRYSEAPESEEEEAKREPLVVKTPDPDELRAVFKRAVASQLGKADPAMVEQLVTSYSGVLANSQRQEHALRDPDGAGGSLVEPPSAAVYAEKAARDADPEQAEAYGMYGRAREFFDLLGEGGL